MKYILSNELLRNICLYILLISLQMFASPILSTFEQKKALVLLTSIMFTCVWLNNRMLFRYTLPQNQPLRHLLFLCLLLPIMMYANYTAIKIIPLHPFQNTWSFWPSLLSSCIFLFVGFGFNSAYREIIRRQSVLEQELLTKRNEIRFLQNQVNPHFLFNSLNNLYAASITEPAMVSERILQMAELLRYQLSCSKREFVTLNEEIEFLENYIDIEKRRLGKQAQIFFEKNGTFGQKEIAPLLFLPFLENAFKYSTGDIVPAVINIRMEGKPNSMEFYVQNTIPENTLPLPTSTGIGIENVQKRLELLYNGQYELSIKPEKKTFEVFLKIYNRC
jgi:two-component system, LytTR family, sensor kinase